MFLKGKYITRGAPWRSGISFIICLLDGGTSAALNSRRRNNLLSCVSMKLKNNVESCEASKTHHRHDMFLFFE